MISGCRFPSKWRKALVTLSRIQSRADIRLIGDLVVLGKYVVCQCITNMCSNTNTPTLLLP
jgi:uncharacterized protein YjeT (DUF2065 family)